MKRLLVVDDEPFAREVFRKVINEVLPDAEIIEAEDGNEAWQIMSNNQIDLAILDINMPFINGVDLIEKIKMNENLKDIPCVVISATTSSEIREKIEKFGHIEVISKIDISARANIENPLVKILKDLN